MGRAQGADRLLTGPPSTDGEGSAHAAWRADKPRALALLELVEGDQVLDVGCGLGDDARAIAGLVGGVSVIGVDTSPDAVREAQARTLGLPRPVDFRLADAYALPFEDAAFDACRADRVLHHLDAPARALAEMARVTRSGGRVVVTDTDYETLVVDAPDAALTRAIVTHHADRMPSGRVGRRLGTLLRDAGLADVRVWPVAVAVTEYDESVVRLRDKAERAVEAGRIGAADAARWIEGLEAAARAGRFFCALTLFLARGWKR